MPVGDLTRRWRQGCLSWRILSWGVKPQHLAPGIGTLAGSGACSACGRFRKPSRTWYILGFGNLHWL